MLIVAAGDAHGSLQTLYDSVQAFERALGEPFAFVLHVGDFGVWPDASRVDRATREHDGAGEFPQWLASGRGVPRRTLMIKGNHEDFDFLASRSSELLSGLTYVPNGTAIVLDGPAGQVVRVGGVGGCFGPSNFDRPSKSLAGSARRHYTSDELDALCALSSLDIVLFHDAPRGVEFRKRMRSGDERRYVSEAQGLAEALERTQPKLCFFGHHHVRVDAVIAGVPCVGLNAIGYRGSLVAVRVLADGAIALVGEWPS